MLPLLLTLTPAAAQGDSDVTQGFTEVHVLRGHQAPATYIVETPAGPKKARPDRDHVQSAFGAAVTPDGRRALTTGLDGTLRVWDLQTGRQLSQIQAHNNWAVGLAVSPDGRQAVTGGNDWTARLWDLESGKEVRRFEGHGWNVWAVALSADGRRLLTGSHDKTVRLWDVETGRELRRFECPGSVWAAALSPDATRVLAPGREAVRLLNAATGAEERALDARVGAALAFSPDGKRALASFGGLLHYCDLATGKKLRQFDAHPKTINIPGSRPAVRGVAFSPDGRWAATTGYDATVRLWDLEAGTELARYNWRAEDTKQYYLFGVAFTPDGRRVVAAGGDGLVRVLRINVEPPAVAKVGPKEEELAGLWTADGGEEWQITREKDHYVGHITGAPPSVAKHFRLGELTLRDCTRTGPDTFAGEVEWRFTQGSTTRTEWRRHVFTVDGDHMSLQPPLRNYVRGAAPRPQDFARTWDSDWGRMDVTVHGNTARGTYERGRGKYGPGTFSGTLTGKVLHAQWKDDDGKAHGTVQITRLPDGEHLAMSWHTAEPGGAGGPPAEKVTAKDPPPADRVRVPALEGRTAQEAREALVKLGLKPGFRMGRAAPAPDQAYRVYEAQPPADAQVALGSEVAVTLYDAVAEKVGSTVQGPTAVDPEPRLTYRYGPHMRFGLSVHRDQAGKPVDKRLTFSADGGTNSTVVRTDGHDGEFGGDQGKWVERGEKLPPDPGGHARDGTRSVWEFGGLRFTQTLEIIAGPQPVEIAPGVQKQVFDTCLVRYAAENLDGQPHRVGLRVQLDTLIGSNDGVPFAVPGLQGIVTTMHDFTKASEVPDFAQALERPDLKHPGTVGHLTFRVGRGLEAPDRVSLTHWPGYNALAWEVPVRNLGGDSAVVMYWNEGDLAPRATRRMGFAYGLARITSREGKIGVNVSGTFEAGQPFTVTAYVSNPAEGETVSLTLPEGLERTQGHATEKVPPLPHGAREGNSVVTWQVRAARPGRYDLSVHSAGGAATPQAVTIFPATTPPDPVAVRPPTPSAAMTLALALPDQLTAGKPFAVTARVTNPLPDQALTLALVPKLERLEGAESQPVPAGTGERTVAWTVKGLEPGQFRVRVLSSSGVEQEKTITIQPASRRFTLLDAQRALKMWVGVLPEEMELDVDGSGRVDSHDAVLILQMAGVRMEKEP